MSNLSVSEYINDTYIDYAKYVLYSRAIPHLMDGLKPGQRKILYTALKNCRTERLKTASLSGQVISCLVGSTKINTSSGESITIEEWYNNHKENTIEVKSSDSQCKEVNGVGHSPVLTKYVTETILLELEDGRSIELTPDHLVGVNRDGELKFISADSLTEDDDIVVL